jgi:hypothetical protein
VRNHLPDGMRIAALCHVEMAAELAMLRATVSSASEFMLGRSPNKTFQVEIVDELITKFRRQEERCSHFERPVTWVCDLNS